MPGDQLLQKTLRDNGFKVTYPRLLVFKVLQNNPPMTMKELVDQLDGRVDRVSAYRILDVFERLSIIKRIAIGWKYRLELGDIFSSHHHHITCISCGKISTVREDEDIERIFTKLGRESGFKVTSHQLELQGYCAICKGNDS